MSQYVNGLLVFFFQAEDGIRDLTVTGVQTCALPIFAMVSILAYYRNSKVLFIGVVLIVGAFITAGVNEPIGFLYFIVAGNLSYGVGEIGRGACRGRE